MAQHSWILITHAEHCFPSFPRFLCVCVVQLAKTSQQSATFYRCSMRCVSVLSPHFLDDLLRSGVEKHMQGLALPLNCAC